MLVFFIPRDNIPDHKNVMVYEQHWPADYPKVIYYGKERPRDFFSTNRVSLCKDCHAKNIMIVLSIDEVWRLNLRQCFTNRTLSGTQNASRACGQSLSPIEDIESEISKILQENLGNLIRRKKDIKIEKFRTVCKSYLSNKKSGWDKNSVLAVVEPTEDFYNLRRIKFV